MTAPADKPASLEQILDMFWDDAQQQDTGSGNWKPDRTRKAIAAITALVPEKQDESVPYPQKHYYVGYNAVIDAIHRNFNRQPQGDKAE